MVINTADFPVNMGERKHLITFDDYLCPSPGLASQDSLWKFSIAVCEANASLQPQLSRIIASACHCQTAMITH